jgi:hypothetical protein
MPTQSAKRRAETGTTSTIERAGAPPPRLANVMLERYTGPARIGPGLGRHGARCRSRPAPRPRSSAPGHADALGHRAIARGHLLLALAEEPEAVLAAGATPEAMRAAALRRLAASPPPARQRFDLEATIADGGETALGGERAGP